MYKTQDTTTGTALFESRVILNDLLLAAGSDAATAKLYDGSSDSDPLICHLAAATGTSERFHFTNGLTVNAVYVVVTGTDATLSVNYS